MQDNQIPARNMPIFIVGTQRSGTTLLTRILSTHPKLFIQNELPLDTIFVNNADKGQIINNIESHFVARYKNTINEFIISKDLTFWGLKDPQLTEHLNSLELFSPDSKFIIIVRDPRGVVNSYIENKWGLGTNSYTGALRWVAEVKQQIDFCERFSENTILLRFEDLIDDLVGSLQLICEHLGVVYDNDMLNYYKKKFEYAPNKQNLNTTKAPNTALKYKWKTHLSSKQLNDIEFVGLDAMRTLGYTLTTAASEPGLLRIMWSKLHQAILGELQIQYRLKVEHKIKRWKAKK